MLLYPPAVPNHANDLLITVLYAHYDGVKGLNASWTGAMRDHVLENTGGAENGVGSAGGNSGG